ncbi:hypothetical protein M3212_10275 [Alkalihalobacillus oceani]|uniref:hypothetical protein n=1 Tax=Halalkalibacter oceani TaxID=1653776 RepID=UPI00203F4E75|nr:hypothetical protein [Halalkalibacter oceani]MCM3761167.1 hypothetical protein [Halalkalibacter oceani]
MKRLLLCLGLMLVVGCSNPVKQEIIHYVNEEVNPIYSLEEEAVDHLSSVTGSNYVDDETFYHTMVEEVLPRYEQFVQRLESIEPQSEELDKVHALFVEGAQLQRNSMRLSLQGVEQGSEEVIQEANLLLEEGKAKIDQYIAEMETLAEQYEVEYEVYE